MVETTMRYGRMGDCPLPNVGDMINMTDRSVEPEKTFKVKVLAIKPVMVNDVEYIEMTMDVPEDVAGRCTCPHCGKKQTPR